MMQNIIQMLHAYLRTAARDGGADGCFLAAHDVRRCIIIAHDGVEKVVENVCFGANTLERV